MARPAVWTLPEFRGLYLSRGRGSMPIGKARVAYDMELTQLGALLSRYNAVQVWGDNLSVRAIGKLSSTIVWATSSDLYAAGSKLRSNWGGQFDWCVAQEELILANGSQVVRTDGSNVYDLGLPSPSAPTATLSSGGSLVEGVAYTYQVTFVDSDGFESNAGTTSNSVTATATDKTVNLTSIPVGGATKDVVSRKIYRAQDGGSHLYIATISDNVTTTYTDTGDTTTAVTPPTNHAAPTATSVSCCFNHRLFLASDNRVQWSLLPPNHKGFPSTYYHDFPYDVKAVRALGDGVAVLTTEGPYMLYHVADATTIRVVRLPWSVPCSSGFTAVELQELVVWQAWRDIYATDGRRVFKLTPELYNYVAGASNASACAYGAKYVLFDPELSFGITSDILGMGCVTKMWSPGSEELYVFSGSEPTRDYGVVASISTEGAVTGTWFSSQLGVTVRVVYDGEAGTHSSELGVVARMVLDTQDQTMTGEYGIVIDVDDSTSGELSDTITFEASVGNPSAEYGVVLRIATQAPGPGTIVDLERVGEALPEQTSSRECYTYRINAFCGVSKEGELYIGTTDGVYVLQGTEASIEWKSGDLNFGAPGLWKNLREMALRARGEFTCNVYVNGGSEAAATFAHSSTTLEQWVLRPTLDLWGHTFEIEFVGVGRLEPPMVFQYDMARLT